MQYLDLKIEHKWQAIQLTKNFLLVVSCYFIWFLPATHDICAQIDAYAFQTLNASLLYSPFWQYIWGYLNHPNENWLNVIFMVSVNIIGIFSFPRSQRVKSLAAVIYFWLFFQFVILFTHLIFSDLLAIKRASPSLVLPSTVILSEILNIPTLKTSTISCFPAGHALVLIFWAKFSLLYSKPWVHRIIYPTVILLILPRLFSGAHWLSDIIFTICYALFCFTLATSPHLFKFATKHIENFLNLLILKTTKQEERA